MLVATRQQLRTSFYRHLSAYRNAVDKTASHWLLLCYAVECGLKVCIMNKDPRLKSTRDLKDDSDMKQVLTHDLNFLLHKAEYGSKGLSSLPRLVMTHNSHVNRVSADRLHEMWRYGIETDTADVQKTVKKLDEIAEWLEEEIA